ncbi:hypothetical protein VPNG_01028 [Cytospora leucostoma]|uniref:Uncharacterized protein n=1 Tax=Cytospora leucostoma TaxID=1230097 RepID=A0A423XM56_9PEZI|nr:hypothetical protein VPNG_01028 [Cytospora leucostoma]
MEKQHGYNGSLIAFEGPADTVSTQMRLLPMSPQILILPSIQTYMSGGDDGRFNSRTFVRRVHEATQTRYDVAMAFLQGSSTNNRRVVFVSGGTAGAVSQCISAISQHQVSGDILRAESSFRKLAQDGVGGLDKEAKYFDRRTPQSHGSEYESRGECWDDEVEDPRTKAMRAADALYEETESLHPIDCFSKPRPRRLSLPVYDHADGVGESSPFLVFGSTPNGEWQSDWEPGSEEPTNYLRVSEDDFAGEHPIWNQHEDTSETFGLPYPPNCVGEPYRCRTAENRTPVKLHSPEEDISLSPPTTPDDVIYGEARLVQMQASRASKPPSGSQTLEEMGLNQPIRRPSDTVTATQVSERMAPRHVPDVNDWHSPIVADPNLRSNLFHIPRARYVKARTTTIRKSPTREKRLPIPTRESSSSGGTDATVYYGEQSGLDESFRPILPLTEDLIIHFPGETHDQVLESVIQSFKYGSFPVSPILSPSSHSGRAYTYPTTAIRTSLSNWKHQAWLPQVAEYSPDEDLEEYAQFRLRNYGSHPSNLAPQSPKSPSAVSVYTGQLPTPTQTPPPVAEETKSRFHRLSVTDRSTAVAIQNELRSVLEFYFPPQQNGGYHQFSFPLLLVMNSMWQPISKESVGDGNKMTERNTDLILAIGCQRGVKRSFLPALMRRIDKLGAKSTGISRSGRLDIRYLIVNTMQSFTAQPLARQTHNNPFENPYLLACLIIPHLETYLAAHPGIRFLLLEYPPEHLATVLALQKLVGMKALKVVGIINSDVTSPSSDVSSSPSSIYSSRSGTLFNKADTNSLDSIDLGATSFPDNKSSLPLRRNPSSSEANYLLTSSATESEIAAFISTILKLLIEIDPSYNPEHNHPQGRPETARSSRDIKTGAGTLPKPMSAFSIHGRDNSSAYTHTPAVPGSAGPSPPTSPYNHHHHANDDQEGSRTPRAADSATALAYCFPFTTPPPPFLHPLRSNPPNPPSPSTTPTSTRWSGQSLLSRSTTRRGLARAAGEGGGDDGASLYAVSVVGDGEYYDDEERRLMPMYMMGQRELRRGNSRKALKWLGLV